MTAYLLGPTSSATVVSLTDAELVADVRYAPRSTRPPVHAFLTASSVEVVEGELSVRAGGATRTYGAGESFDLPPGTRHTMWNASHEPTRTRWRATPAGRTAEWFVRLDAVNRAGGGLPEVALVTREFRDVLRVAGLRGAAIPLLAVVGRLRSRLGPSVE